MKSLLIVDAHAMIHRAFHALPELTAPDGTPTNAIHGYFLILLNALETFQPSHVAITFDTPSPTFRKNLYPQYRANRPPVKESLVQQIPRIRTLTKQCGLITLSQDGFEADDLIGSLVKRFNKMFDAIHILTGDKDLFQLVNSSVFVVMPKRGVSTFLNYTPQQVKEKMRVNPDQIVDLKALAGDPSDNYPGIRGLGPKTAEKLLSKFGHVDELYKKLEEVEPNKLRNRLQEQKEVVYLCKKLATISDSVPLQVSDVDMQFIVFDQAVKADLHSYGLTSIEKKMFGGNQKPVSSKRKSERKEKKSEKPADQMSMF